MNPQNNAGVLNHCLLFGFCDLKKLAVISCVDLLLIFSRFLLALR
jgi:hypothetical protein